jgi:hypothetical protein
MANRFKVGDHVRWNSEAGHVTGRIIKLNSRDTEYQGHSRHASEDEPQYEIRSDYTWAIRFLVVETSNWWGGQRVLVASEWITDVSWPEAKVSVDLTRQAVKSAPPYDAAVQVDRHREQGLYEHYSRRGYWTTETPQRRPPNYSSPCCS